MPKIRLLIVDDHPIVCEGLKAFFSYLEDVEVIGIAHDGMEAMSLLRDLQPDIVLMDIAMPRINGIEATKLIHRQYPGIRVLILTEHDEPEYVAPLLKAGASGIVLKRAMADDLVTALHLVARGEIFLYPSIATAVVEDMRKPSEANGKAARTLTSRESEILRCIVLGQTNAHIAAALQISIKTVEWHRANLMIKLDAHSVADLVRYALRYGLVEATN